MPDLNLIYRSRLLDSTTTTPAPAIVLVHGWLGNEDMMWVFESSLPKNAAIFSPRAPFAADGGFGWFAHDADAGGDESFTSGLIALREFVTRLPTIAPIDPARIVLVGFSQGAAMCGALALSDPPLIAGVALLAGFLPEHVRAWAQPHSLQGKAVFIAHGADDDTVPVAEAARARDVFTQAGADVTYGEYPVGHKMSAAGLRALKAWLVEKTFGVLQTPKVSDISR